MRKIILILALIPTMLFSQEKFAEYDAPYLSKSFEIRISLNENDKYTLYIEAGSMDGLIDEGGFFINEKQLENFLFALGEAKLKYVEWSDVAKENKITSYSKAIDIKSKKIGGYFKFGDWNYDYYVSPEFYFMVLEFNSELKHLLIVRSGKLQSSSNQFMTCDGFVLTFTSAEDISNFIDLISIDRINKYKLEPKKDDLFKNNR